MCENAAHKKLETKIDLTKIKWIGVAFRYTIVNKKCVTFNLQFFDKFCMNTKVNKSCPSHCSTFFGPAGSLHTGSTCTCCYVGQAITDTGSLYKPIQTTDWVLHSWRISVRGSKFYIITKFASHPKCKN